MEALAAASLAGNILQFIDTTSKLVSTARQLHSLGAKQEYRELETIAKEIRDHAEQVTPSEPPEDKSLSKEEEGLRALGRECVEITNELIPVLDKLKAKEGQSKLRSFYQTVLSEWKKEEIAALEKRLDRMGQNLSNSLVHSDQRKLYGRIDQLAEDNRRLQANRSQEINELKEDFRKAFAEIRSEQNRRETLNKVSVLLLHAGEKGIQYSAEQLLLEQLRFDVMDDRHVAISAAHKQTFAWIFEEASNDQRSLPEFDDWLASEDNLYWITGKPGSGKSTLMKYLCKHQKTRTKLSRWACDHRLITANFFFWNAGRNSLQKSQQGLLRSLVYQILRECPSIISQVYSDLWPAYSLATRNQGEDPVALWPVKVSIHDLLAVLRKAIVLLSPSDVRFGFFIDGLDEYDGEPQDIIELIRTLRNFTNVKICISSRPWNEFEQAFGQDASRKLYMQEFNKGDISLYIHDELEQDSEYEDLDGDESCRNELIAEINEASQGVFLWVHLVVQSFQQGLINGDRIVDLQAKLRTLPTDLNDYFERILFSDVGEFYRQQSAKMFSVTLAAMETLPLMIYWFIDQDTSPIDMNIGAMSMQKTTRSFRQIRKRLNNLCKGLLEVRYVSAGDSEDALPSSVLFNWKVDFLHRTVRDFLITPDTQRLLKEMGPREL